MQFNLQTLSAKSNEGTGNGTGRADKNIVPLQVYVDVEDLQGQDVKVVKHQDDAVKSTTIEDKENLILGQKMYVLGASSEKRKPLGEKKKVESFFSVNNVVSSLDFDLGSFPMPPSSFEKSTMKIISNEKMVQPIPKKIKKSVRFDLSEEATKLVGFVPRWAKAWTAEEEQAMKARRWEGDSRGSVFYRAVSLTVGLWWEAPTVEDDEWRNYRAWLRETNKVVKKVRWADEEDDLPLVESKWLNHTDSFNRVGGGWWSKEDRARMAKEEADEKESNPIQSFEFTHLASLSKQERSVWWTDVTKDFSWYTDNASAEPTFDDDARAQSLAKLVTRRRPKKASDGRNGLNVGEQAEFLHFVKEFDVRGCGGLAEAGSSARGRRRGNREE